MPHEQPSHKGLYKSIHMLRILPTDRQMERGKKQIIKQIFLTCEAGRAFAGVLWRGWWLTCCSACGSIQTAVWFYQAGIAYILTKLSNPSWGTNTLQQNSTIFVRSGYSIHELISPNQLNLAHRGVCKSNCFVFTLPPTHWLSTETITMSVKLLIFIFKDV